MPTGDVVTYSQNGMWHNKREGLQAAPASSHRTRDEAVEHGRKMALLLVQRGEFYGGRSTVEHIVHNLDGTIGQRNTYPRSADPRATRG